MSRARAARPRRSIRLRFASVYSTHVWLAAAGELLLSVIIPTLNAAGVLSATVDGVQAGQGVLALEILVADGGSIDDTRLIATQKDVIFLEAPRGRGQQLAKAAAETAGDWLLFLHADTRLSPGWWDAAKAFIADPRNEHRAGYFRFRLDDDARAARLLEVLVRWRCRLFGLPYGDQGLLISRAFYEALGGYKRIPLMEDVDLAARIGRRNLRPLNARALTSPEKYRRDGYLLRPLRNLVCLGLYSVGVSPRYIAGLYR